MLTDRTAAGIPSAPGYIPGIYIQKLAYLAEEEGLGFRSLWNQLPDSDRCSSGRVATVQIKYSDYLGIVRGMLDTLQRNGLGDGAGLGLRFGAQFGIVDYGILGYSLLSCRDLGQCLQTLQKLSGLFGNIAELEGKFIWREGEVACQWTSYLIDEDLARFELESCTAQFMALNTLLREPERFQPMGVSFSFPEPPVTRDYSQLFHCPIRFSQAVTELVLPSALLDEPFALANKEAREACTHQCRILLKDLKKGGLLTERVRQLVFRSPRDVPELEDISRQLNLSARTLRRKLAQESTTYQEIVTSVRAHLARRYLSDTMLEIKEISYLLGYSEVANFQRAFKNWVGQAPGEYRSIRTG